MGPQSLTTSLGQPYGHFLSDGWEPLSLGEAEGTGT